MSDAREKIDLLGQTKDSIVAYFLGRAHVDDPTRLMWVSDAKQVYFLSVAAYDMAFRTKSDEEGDVKSSKGLLASARSSMEQCSSELKALGDDEAKRLDSDLRETFEGSFNAISAELDALSPPTVGSPPVKPVVRISETEYTLLCSACGKLAARFKVGPMWPSSTNGETALLYEGITRSTQLSLADSDTVFGDLKSEAISALNSFLENKMEGGLDAYCPSCDKVYCREDYDVEEEWDEGFYDCSYGTCPAGHRRLIDD
jgi:hypothetical protein